MKKFHPCSLIFPLVRFIYLGKNVTHTLLSPLLNIWSHNSQEKIPIGSQPLLFPDFSWNPVPGKVSGEVKLSITFKSDKLFIMVMHIRALVSVTKRGWDDDDDGDGFGASPDQYYLTLIINHMKHVWRSQKTSLSMAALCPLLHSNHCRRAQTPTPMSNSTSSPTPRKPARGRPRLPTAHATLHIMRW